MERLLTYEQVITRLKEIKQQGYVKTHRSGDTGIGKTLEDFLGIKENNIPGPNAANLELKSARKSASSMLTLLTRAPLPRGSNSILLQRFGYESARGNQRKELHTTVNAKQYNKLKGAAAFKIDIKGDQVNLITPQNEILAYWDKEILRKAFERKCPKLLYVKADSRSTGANEEFWFNEAWLLSGFDFSNFVRLLREGVILVDVRIGQYPNGRSHDHGTAFRILPKKFDLCFAHREKVI